MDRLDAMATLVAAVDGGSLSAASRALRTPLATVSRKVADLEARLGAQLVVRTSRRLLLTDAGRAYVAACRLILDQVEDAERVAAGEYRTPRGHLSLTAPIMFGRLHVEPVVLAFLRAFPDISARLVLADHVVSLVDDHMDLGVRIGRLQDSSQIAVRLGDVRWVICASPDYLETRGEPADPDALADHDCLMFEGLYSSTVWTVGRGRSVRDVPIRPRFAVNSADAAIAAAIEGAGVTRVLSYQVAEAVRSGALRLILTSHAPDPLPVHLIYPDQSQLPLKLRAFLDFAAPRLKASLLGHLS